MPDDPDRIPPSDFEVRVRLRASLYKEQRVARAFLRRAHWLRSKVTPFTPPDEVADLRAHATRLEREVADGARTRRELHLRYCMLRGRTYEQVEPKARTTPPTLLDDLTFRLWLVARTKTRAEIEVDLTEMRKKDLREAQARVRLTDRELRYAALRAKTAKRHLADLLRRQGQDVSPPQAEAVLPPEAPTDTPKHED